MTSLQTSLAVAGGGQQVVVVKTYQHARKLFRIGERPAGVLTWGVGALGPRSVENLVLDVSRQTPDAATVEQIAGLVRQTVDPLYQQTFGTLPQDQQPEMGFIVAGYTT